MNGKVWKRDYSVRRRGEGVEEGEGEGGWNIGGDVGENTCLHEAVGAGNVCATRWLLEKGNLDI